MNGRGIWQRHNDECGLACVAYFLQNKINIKNPLIMARLHVFPNGRAADGGYLTDASNLRAGLKRFGITLKRRREFSMRKKWSSPEEVAKFAGENFDCDGIIATNSRREGEEWHWVAFDNKRKAVFDPWKPSYKRLCPIYFYGVEML